MTLRFLLSLLLVASLGCKKDNKDPSPVAGGDDPDQPTLYPPLSLAVDSACISTGNVFTPNFDGINDVLYIVALNVNDVVVELKYEDGTLIYSGNHTDLLTSDILPAPDPDDPPLRLDLKVSGISYSGNSLEGTTKIYTVILPQEQCFSNSVAPVTPDQFVDINGIDPICEPLNISYDQFCTF